MKPPPRPPPPGSKVAGRLADILAQPLASFVFPAHAVPVAKTLVDIAVGLGGENGGEEGPAAAAAALELLTALVSRARGEAAAAVFDPRASGSGSLFAPVAALLDGPHSAAALDLLTKVATGTAAAARGPPPPTERCGRLGTSREAWGAGDDVGQRGRKRREGGGPDVRGDAERGDGPEPGGAAGVPGERLGG